MSSRRERTALYFTAAASFAMYLYWLLPKGVLKRSYYSLVNPRAFHTDAALSFDAFLAHQGAVSWRRLLDNVHPPGTSAGCVVASPSRFKPNYFYQWTRDSSLVLKAVVQRYKEGDESLLSIMLDFVEATQEMQHKDTPSGTFRDGGLGEVKFEVNREPFTGSWGRPQRDGPALRASLLINFARQYLRVGGSAADSFVAKTLFDHKDDSDTVIKADLNYVASTWSQKGFDLWEEVNGHHFFTLLVSYRAMKDGAAFAREREDPRSAARYDEAASEISARLRDFYDPEKGYIQVTLDTVRNHGKDSGLDTCIVLGVLHAGDEAGEWTVTDDRVLATHFAVVESMRREYPINARYKYKYGTGVGRYVEDVYDGVDMSRAHPWYLCTLAHAELLYRAADAFASKPITISSLTRPFFEALRGPEAPLPDGQISAAEQQSLVAVMRSRADEFVDVVRDWKTPQGNLSEQFSRYDGSPQGAKDLTWSYAAFLSMKAAREGKPVQ